MGLLALEHGRIAYRIDFALYGMAIAGLSGFLWWSGHGLYRLDTGVRVAAGVGLWTALEYLSHRFVLHGVSPFCRWHAEHHRRPAARIYTPTLLSAALFAVVVFLPAWWLGDGRRASALLLGVLAGYVLYALTHHALHHWRSRAGSRLQHWHARHHHAGAVVGCFGVTNRFWDVLLLTDGRPVPAGWLRRLAGRLVGLLLGMALLWLLMRQPG